MAGSWSSVSIVIHDPVGKADEILANIEFHPGSENRLAIGSAKFKREMKAKLLQEQ